MSSTKTATGRELISIHVSIIMHKIPFRRLFCLGPLIAEHLANTALADLRDALKNGCMKQKLQLNVQLSAYANHELCTTSFCMYIFA